MEYAKNMGCMINTLGVGLHTTSMQIPDFFKKNGMTGVTLGLSLCSWHGIDPGGPTEYTSLIYQDAPSIFRFYLITKRSFWGNIAYNNVSSYHMVYPYLL